MQGLSSDVIIGSLFIGAVGPPEGSASSIGDGFKYHRVGDIVDENTVFEIESKGRTLFLKNVRSTVHLQGWESITPEIHEAESAAYFNAVSINVWQVSSVSITQPITLIYAISSRLLLLRPLPAEDHLSITAMIRVMWNGI